MCKVDAPTITAIAAAIAVVITSVTSLIVAIRGVKKTEEVHTAVNEKVGLVQDTVNEVKDTVNGGTNNH